jgi:hypothetical protein
MDFPALAATWDVELVERLGLEGPVRGVDEPVLRERIAAAALRGRPEAELGAAALVLARNHGSLLPLTARTLRRVTVFGDVDLAFPRATVEHADDPERARDADLALVVGGSLAGAVAEVNPKTVVVLEARVEMPWLSLTPAVLVSFAPVRAEALADVLLGVLEPGGRMPVAWPEFTFGHGLGYTTWDYLARDGAKVRLANTGTRRGREVVQLFDDGRLIGFCVVEADPGVEVTVDVPLA